MPSPILPGSEPWSHNGGPDGVLVIHGFIGSPQSMRGLADAFAAAGFSVEMPLLPGHGTSVEDMVDTAWPDWTTEVEAAYGRLCERCDRVVVAGLSMGGALTVRLATEHPGLAGIVCVNPAVEPDADMFDLISGMVDSGEEYMDGVGGDVADPEVDEVAYARTPLRSLLSFLSAGDDLAPHLGDIACPTLIITSANDHVVPPSNSDYLAGAVGGPVERIVLERSFHVATIDYDHDVIEREAVAFAERVTSEPTG
jgi:carboxylesterase